MSCICEDETLQQEYSCPVCSKLFTEKLYPIERYVQCPEHEGAAMCGIPDHVCPSCKEEGWYSTKGSGGPTQYINRLTGEERSPPKRVKPL